MVKPRRLWIALGAAVVAGSAVLVLVVRGERVTGGRATRDDVIAATFGAMAAGDVDALVALIDPVAMFALAVECKDEADADRDREAREDRARNAGARDSHVDRDAEASEEQARNAAARDPRAIRDRARTDYAPLVARAKGLSIDVVSITEAGPPNQIAKGAAMMRGCVATRALAFHRSRVKLRIRGQASDPEVVVATVEVAGRWFLSTPPVLRD